MPTWIISILEWAFSWFFGGRQQTQGEAQGKAEQGQADATQELENEAAAEAARNSVRDDPASVLNDPNNAGPVKRN